MSLLKRRLYRKLVPKIFRGDYLFTSLKQDIIDYYSSLPDATAEQISIVRYLRANPITVYPYAFQEKYAPADVSVYTDDASGLKYVLEDGKRLYFKRRFREADIRRYYSGLQKEQDPDSPHRYLSEAFSVEDGDVVADVGVAEGNFSLSVIEKAGRLILFETDDEWIEALQATFEPWKEKVRIVKRRVSDRNDSENTTLDEYFKTDRIDFLKVDIDGAESALLKGSEKILNNVSRIALCVYHKQDDERDFSVLLEDKGFEVSLTKGYMIYIFDKKLDVPYLRRGLIRAFKAGGS